MFDYIFLPLITDFLYKFVWNIYHFKKNWARNDRKYTLVFMWSTRYSCQILMKREFSRQIFEKWANNKFHENPFSGNPVVARGQTDTHDRANIRFSQLSERAWQKLCITNNAADFNTYLKTLHYLSLFSREFDRHSQFILLHISHFSSCDHFNIWWRVPVTELGSISSLLGNLANLYSESFKYYLPISEVASLLTCEILSLCSMDDDNYSLMGHDAVFIGNLLPSLQERSSPFLQGYARWKGLITLSRRIEIGMYV